MVLLPGSNGIAHKELAPPKDEDEPVVAPEKHAVVGTHGEAPVRYAIGRAKESHEGDLSPVLSEETKEGLPPTMGAEV